MFLKVDSRKIGYVNTQKTGIYGKNPQIDYLLNFEETGSPWLDKGQRSPNSAQKKTPTRFSLPGFYNSHH